MDQPVGDELLPFLVAGEADTAERAVSPTSLLLGPSQDEPYQRFIEIIPSQEPPGTSMPGGVGQGGGHDGANLFQAFVEHDYGGGGVGPADGGRGGFQLQEAAERREAAEGGREDESITASVVSSDWHACSVTEGTGQEEYEEGSKAQQAGLTQPSTESAVPEKPRRHKLTEVQVEACERAFREWGGTCRQRAREVEALASHIGLTPQRFRKRFDYLRKQFSRAIYESMNYAAAHPELPGRKRLGHHDEDEDSTSTRGSKRSRQSREPGDLCRSNTFQNWGLASKRQAEPAVTRHILEVIVTDVESALRAKEGGADRVEVCANLRDGGVTPSIGLVSQIIRHLRKKPRTRVHVLCRPRAGDFYYNEEEFEVLKKDVIAMKSAGADGVVIGVLKHDRTIDVQRTAKLIAAARPMSVTFHRAFDDVKDPAKALADLIKLGADRVLTSGLASTAWEGQHTIRALVHAAQGRIIILAGAGVNYDNVTHLIEATGVTEVHVGTGAEEEVASAYNPAFVPDTQACRPTRTHKRVSTDKVGAIRSLITAMAMQEVGQMEDEEAEGEDEEEEEEEEEEQGQEHHQPDQEEEEEEEGQEGGEDDDGDDDDEENDGAMGEGLREEEEEEEEEEVDDDIIEDDEDEGPGPSTEALLQGPRCE